MKTITLLALMGIAGTSYAQTTSNVTVQFADHNSALAGTRYFVPSASVNGTYTLPVGTVPVTVAGKLGLKANVPNNVNSYFYRTYGGVQVSAVYNSATLYLNAERDFARGVPTTLRAGVIFGTPVHFYGDR